MYFNWHFLSALVVWVLFWTQREADRFKSPQIIFSIIFLREQSFQVLWQIIVYLSIMNKTGMPKPSNLSGWKLALFK